jgi:phosphoribosylglycinamide formyltransferase-1
VPRSFVSESIIPLETSFDTDGMARGEPGLPKKFRWRKKDFIVAEVLERWKEHGTCAHGSGEKYVRKHRYCIRTTDGSVFRLSFQRTFGRAKYRYTSRWWISSMEDGL